MDNDLADRLRRLIDELMADYGEGVPRIMRAGLRSGAKVALANDPEALAHHLRTIARRILDELEE